MSAEILRRAASLMRERAEAAPSAPWGVDEVGAVWVSHDPRWASSSCLVDRFPIWADGSGEHIASWHPAVALAVADWLDYAAKYADWVARQHPDAVEADAMIGHATTIATAYLGEGGDQ